MAAVTVDLTALQDNAKILKNTVGDFFAVLKCGAYGHGDFECAEALYASGVKKFAVFDLTEAERIKPAVENGEILILGRTPAKFANALSAGGFIQSVGSEEYLSELAQTGKNIKIHLETESGMNRSGFEKLPEKFLSDNKTSLDVRGIFTHFPDADFSDPSSVFSRFEKFVKVAEKAERLCKKKLLKHCAASASAIRFPEMRMDACRIGLALYGILPENAALSGLSPVLTLSGKISEVKTLKKGETVGYGCDYRAERDTVTVTVDAGYSDGLFRGIYKEYKPQFRGKRVPFAGKICMDRCMLDVTDALSDGKLPEAGERVDFITSPSDVCEMARRAGTIPYEIFTSLSSARERFYKK